MYAAESIQKIIVLLAVGAERHFYAYIDVQVLMPDITTATTLTESNPIIVVTTWRDSRVH